MDLQNGFDKALNFTKLATYLACTWPPPSSATKWQIIRYNIRWCVCFTNASCILLGLLVSIHKYHENLLMVTQSVSFAGAVTSLMIKMITYRIRLKPTQTQIEEMENFFRIAGPREKMILQDYSARFSKLHIFVYVLTFITSSMLILSPLIRQHQPLPFLAVYPFSVDSGVVWSLAFIQQVILTYQCASGVATVCQAAVVMWFAGARLKILAEETKSILEGQRFSDFVDKHNNRLAYAVDVSKSMRYVALTSSMASGLSAITSSVMLLSNQPLAFRMKFMPLAIVGMINLFVCAWPADHLINMCYSLGDAAYNISWFGMRVSTKKNLLTIIQRSQRPIIVSVGGLLPTVSLRSYAAFLAAVYSYVTALRAITADGTK